MIKVDQYVMIRDPFITNDNQIPPAKVIEIKTNKHNEKILLLEFEDKSRDWYPMFMVKEQ